MFQSPPLVDSQTAAGVVVLTFGRKFCNLKTLLHLQAVGSGSTKQIATFKKGKSIEKLSINFAHKLPCFPPLLPFLSFSLLTEPIMEDIS